ncbi:MAG: hypothetical protein UHN88_03840 [Eubacterium sp.]|nr:hypothetical protein [Eubacterium sp.]
MHIEQFVMAYKVEQDRIRAILPEGFESLRPVMRINTEIREGERAYIEFNTPVAHEGKRGWLNIGNWEGPDEGVSFEKQANTTRITTRITAPFLKLSYTGVGIEGGCPAERDNDGCFFLSDNEQRFVPAERITENKEFCDCEFAWKFGSNDAHGVSIGRTLPAPIEDVAHQYERADFTPQNAAAIPCEQVLGAYIVRFER